MRKILIILLALLITSSCRMPESFGFYQPITMELAVPDGPPEYKAGWHAGCKSALGAKLFANASVYQTGAGPTFGSGAYTHDPMYQTGWGQAWYACMLTVDEFTKRHATKFAPLD